MTTLSPIVPQAEARPPLMPQAVKDSIPDKALRSKALNAYAPAVPAPGSLVDVRHEAGLSGYDRFVIYANGAAAVFTLHGTEYDIDADGRCPCIAYGLKRSCRHTDKLSARVGAERRLTALHPGASVAGSKDRNEKCPECGLWVVDVLLWGVYAGDPAPENGIP